jgi:hypothetical protein
MTDESGDLPDDVLALIRLNAVPPKIVAIGNRRELENGIIRIITHVELWTWRVVVRGSMLPPPPWKRVGPLGSADDRGAARAQLHAWHLAWRLTDDVGTVYVLRGSGGGGDGSHWDFDVRFDPQVPPDARVLSIHVPDDTLTISLT